MGDLRERIGQFFNRNQSQEPQQPACRLGDQSCGTAQVDTQSYRQAAANAAQPAQLPGASAAPSQAVPQYSSGRCGQVAQPVDTSKATDLGNGVHAQVNRNGTVTVVLPLPNGGQSQVEYTWTRPNESAPRQTMGYSEKFRARGETGDPLVFHRQEDGSLQITVTGPTTGAVWIDNKRHELDPTKIKAEIAKIKTAPAPASAPPATPATPSSTTPITSTVSPTPTIPTLSAPTPSAGPALTPSAGPTPLPILSTLPSAPPSLNVPTALPLIASTLIPSSPSDALPSLLAGTPPLNPATPPTMRDPLPGTEPQREVRLGDGANIPSAAGRELLSEINRGLSTLSDFGRSVVSSLTSGAAPSGAPTTESVTTPPSSSTTTPTPSTSGASTTPPVATVSTVTPPVADLPKAPAPDPQLAELRGKMQLAISQLTGADSLSTAGDTKAVLQALLKTVNEVEKNLREHRNELATRWTDLSLTTEQKEAIAKQITEIDKALTGGLAAAVETVGAKRPNNLTRFDAEEFSKQFAALLAPPPTPAPTILPSSTGMAGSGAGTATVASRESSRALKDIVEDMQAEFDELSLIPGDELDRGRIELKRIIDQTKAIEQKLLEEREKLRQEISPNNTDKDKQILERIAQIDELLDYDIPGYLNEEVYKSDGTLQDLSKLIQVKIRSNFGDELRPLNEAPSLHGQELSAGEQREIEIDPGEAIQIVHNGVVVAKVHRNIDGSLSPGNIDPSIVRNPPVTLEISGNKLFVHTKADLASEASVRLDRIELATGALQRDEHFKVVRRDSLDPVNVAEVDRIKSRIEELRLSSPTNGQVLDALVTLDKFTKDGDGVKITSPDGKYELRVNRDLEVSAVALPVTDPAPAASSSPSTTPAATAPATEVSKLVEQIQVAVSTLPDLAAREQFLKAMGFSQRGSDWGMVSTNGSPQRILVKDITGTPRVELEPLALPLTGASADAERQVEGLNAALSTLSDPAIFKPYLSAQGFKAEGDTLVKNSLDPNYNIVVDNKGIATLVRVAPTSTTTPPSPAPELPRSDSGHSSPESTALSPTPGVTSGTTTPSTSPTATLSFKPTREQALAALETERVAAEKHATETHKDDARDLAYAQSEIDYMMEYATAAINAGQTEMTLEMAAVQERNEVVLGELGYERSADHPGYLVREIEDGYRMIHPALGLAEEQMVDERGTRQAFYKLNNDLTRGTLYASYERQPSGNHLQTGGNHKWVRGSWVTAADIEKLDLTVQSIEGKLNDFSSTEEERLMVIKLIKETDPGHRSYIIEKYKEVTSRTLESDLDYHFSSGWQATTPEQETLDRTLFGFNQRRQASVIHTAITYDGGAFGWDHYEAVIAATSDLNGFQQRAIEHTFNRFFGEHGRLRQRLAHELTVDERRSEILANMNFK